MDKHVVIGTAGHVDHGKTALVKALTGTDTDRWAEEKRRGITIDLGFAFLELGDGVTASIVDVPGHEDFVRNMVAGATGVDVALLVIAADEGVMPQTTEHLAILEFLAVETGVVAITKADLVESDWLSLVQDDVRERIANSSVKWADVLCVSSVAETGLDDLRGALRRVAKNVETEPQDDLFRLPVDRVFSIAGAGTVVTGTTWSGTINVGDDVRILPGEHTARVRGVEVHGRTQDSAMPGCRTALALVGLDRADVARGHVVVTAKAWRETTSIDAFVELLPESRPLTQRSRIRVHMGTAEVMARITPADGAIKPGTRAAVRLRLERPVVCRWGDRVVVRSYSPVTTIGGCVVADPWPAARPRRPVALERRALADLAQRVTAFVEVAAENGLSRHEMSVRVGIPLGRIEGAVQQAVGVVSVKNRLFTEHLVEAACERTLEAVSEYHQTYPLEPGMPHSLARQVVPDIELAEFVQARLVERGVVVAEGESVRLAEHRATLTGSRVELSASIRTLLQRGGVHGRTLAELGTELGSSDVKDVAEFLVREGTAVRVGTDRYYDRVVLDGLTGDVLREINVVGQATPAQLREKTGLSRKFLIPLLEWMDGQRLTVRRGDARGAGPAAKQ